MNNYESKRSSICRLELISLAEAEVVNIPGNNIIKVDGIWDRLDFSTIDFSEKPSDDGSLYDVSLNIGITDNSVDAYNDAISWVGIYILAKLVYSDGTIRIVGSDSYPLVLSIGRSGSSSVLSLIYSGQQPELSKYL